MEETSKKNPGKASLSAESRRWRDGVVDRHGTA